MAINSVVVAGNLTYDSELKGEGTVLKFSLAVNNRKKDPETGQWGDDPCYVDCVLFGRRAESLAPYLVRGKHVTVSGHLQQSRWATKDGQKRSKLEIVVDELDLGAKSEQQPAQSSAAVSADTYEDDIPF